MIHEADRAGFDEAALVESAGALPDAPLPMPKQRLEGGASSARGLLARLAWPRRAPGADLGHSGG